jgi:cupin fold WbuC family metalloprotein
MKLLSAALLDELAVKAAASPRARAPHTIHSGPADLVQRFIVVAQGDSYFRPHRHNARAELALIVRGDMDVLTFDEDGRVTARYGIGSAAGTFAYETPQRTWHTVVPGEHGAAFFEVKEGPYDPATASESAPWSPLKGTRRGGLLARRAGRGSARRADCLGCPRRYLPSLPRSRWNGSRRCPTPSPRAQR